MYDLSIQRIASIVYVIPVYLMILLLRILYVNLLFMLDICSALYVIRILIMFETLWIPYPCLYGVFTTLMIISLIENKVKSM